VALAAAVLLVVGAVLLSVLGLRPPSLDERARALESELRCPVCQGLSIADSPAALAGEMRRVVVQQVSVGTSDADVRAYFVERYGSWILLAPDGTGPNLFLWAAPGLLLIGGAAVVVGRARRRQSGSARGAAEPLPSETRRPLVLAALISVVVAAIAVPLAVAVGPRAVGAQITGGQPTTQPAPTIADLVARVAADPTDVGALVALGDGYAGGGDTVDAAEAYGRALKIQPDDVGGLVGLAALLLGSGRPDGALPLVDRAVVVAPDLPDPYLLRAIARYQLAGSVTADVRADALRFLDLAPNDSRRSVAQQLLATADPGAGP
jgi:cytochrome c-type biogenesis protein CcmH